MSAVTDLTLGSVVPNLIQNFKVFCICPNYLLFIFRIYLQCAICIQDYEITLKK